MNNHYTNEFLAGYQAGVAGVSPSANPYYDTDLDAAIAWEDGRASVN